MGENEDRISLRISDDGLEAWVAIGAGMPQSAQVLLEKIDAAGVVAGLDAGAVEGLGEALALESATASERCIARGRAARSGVPPVLELVVPAGLQPGTEREDRSLDYRERQLIVPVERGEVLGRIVPGTPGCQGFSVRGESIEPEPPAANVIQTGEGVSIDEAGQLVALRAGARLITPPEVVSVVDHFSHAGDVDLHSGNLETRGSLQVGKDVHPGMSVTASGDLVIGGLVDGATVEANGSVEIKGGVVGQQETSIRAGGDLRIGHAHGARLYARGCLRVARSVSTSILSAHEIEVEGRLLGDEAKAETRLILKDLGSPAGGPCHVRAAYPLDPEDFDPSLAPIPIEGALPAGGRRAQSLAGRKSRTDRRHRGARKPTFQSAKLNERVEWRRKERELQKHASIEIRGVAHPGSRLSIGPATLRLEEGLEKKRIRYCDQTGELVVEEF